MKQVQSQIRPSPLEGRPPPLTRRDAIYCAAGATATILLGGCRGESPAPPQQGTLITGGTLVSDKKMFDSDIRIRGEKIVEVGVGLEPESADDRLINARDCLVLPGGIDPHVHLGAPWADDFRSGSQAALAGGITTLGHMSFQRRGRSIQESVVADENAIRKSSIADVFLHPVVDVAACLETGLLNGLAADGHTSIKIFMLTESFAGSAAKAEDAVRAARNAGMMTMFHAEDKHELDRAIAKLKTDNQTSLQHYSASRPVQAELAATQTAIEICRNSGAAVYLVHLSSAAALRECARARESGLPVFVETRPMYLHLTDEIYRRDDVGLYIGMPPVRSQSDQDALWTGIERGTVQVVASDHAPWTRQQKLDETQSIEAPNGGVNNLQVMLPMLMDGMLKRKIPLSRFAQVTSTNPARLFGLYPEKGCLDPGSDADLVVWNSKRPRVIDGSRGYSKAGYSIYDGKRVSSWPVVTLRRGEVVFENEKIVASGGGRLLKRRPLRFKSPDLNQLNSRQRG